MKKSSVALESFQSTSLAPASVLIGIDWADKEHAFACRTPDGKLYRGSFNQSPSAIREWVEFWTQKYPNLPLEVCIESCAGHLLMPSESSLAYTSTQSTRRACELSKCIRPRRRKERSCRCTPHSQVHRTKPGPTTAITKGLTRDLRTLRTDSTCRQLVEERVALANRLGALWKQYFPAICDLKPSKAYSEFVIKLTLKYPTLDLVQKAGKAKLRKFFYSIGTKEKMESRLELLMNSVPITTDPVILRTCARQCQAIAAQIDVLNQSIKGYDAEIKRLVKQHQDYPIVATLPGASDNTHARLIAALGDDRNRYDSAEALQAAAGIAPITTQSGKSRYVKARWACSKFLKQTFHEYAGLSIAKCDWARRYYEQMLAKGKSKQMARRALAYKWLRIIYRCWKTSQPYNETHYLARLKETGSKLASA